MERIRKALVTTDSPKGFYHPQGQFEIIVEENMEIQWEQEVENYAKERGLNEEQIDALFGIKRMKPRYTVVLHIDKGITEYPDEIE